MGEPAYIARASQGMYRLTGHGASAARDAFACPRPAALLGAFIAGTALGAVVGTGAGIRDLFVVALVAALCVVAGLIAGIPRRADGATLPAAGLGSPPGGCRLPR